MMSSKGKKSARAQARARAQPEAARMVVERSIVPTLVVNIKKVHTFRFQIAAGSSFTFRDTDLLRIAAIGAPTVALPNQLVALFTSVRLLRARLYNLPDSSLSPTQSSIEWSGSAGVDSPLEYKSTVDYTSNAGSADLVPSKQSNAGFWLNPANIGGVNFFKVTNVGSSVNFVDVTIEGETGDIDHSPSVFSATAATTVGVQYSVSNASLTPVGYSPYTQ
jgi:hypothetical protein